MKRNDRRPICFLSLAVHLLKESMFVRFRIGSVCVVFAMIGGVCWSCRG